MVSLEEFLCGADALRTTRETVGEALYGLSSVLRSDIGGGTQLAYDVTVVLPGPREINIVQDAVNPGGDQHNYLEVVTKLRYQTIAQRMSTRASAKVAGTPLLKSVAAIGGISFAPPQTNPATGASVLSYMTPYNVQTDEEVAMLVCCAGLSDLFNEMYAGAIAATCSLNLVSELARINASLNHVANAA